MITVSQLWIYPFKSGKGLSVPSSTFDNVGMSNDRRLVALDKNGVFLTARRHPQLLLLSCTKTDKGWLLQHPSMLKKCEIAPNESANVITGTLWKDAISATDAGDEAANWLSSLLKKDVRIAMWREQSRHSNKYQLESSFSDASPVLMASEASVEQACSWGGITPDVRRFRPNIVLTGVDAFSEDSWSHIRIGDVHFAALDCCVRCILTTINPDTCEAHPSKQPMVALQDKHANASRQPLFGINLRLNSEKNNATVVVGDEVTLLS